MLAYRGIDIHELAEHSNFEETTYLLWFGVLPTAAQLAEFTKELAAARTLNWRIYDFLRSVPTDATPMEVLRTAVSLLSLYDPDEKDSSHDANVRKSYRLTSQIAMIVAIFDRIRKGKSIIDPDKTLSHCGELSAHAERGEAFGDGDAGAGCCADPAGRPRAECEHVCGAGDRVDAVGHALGDHGRDRRAEGTAARRRQRGDHEAAVSPSTRRGPTRWSM